MIQRRPSFAFTNGTPYLALRGELWGAFREIFKEIWSRYIESTLYFMLQISLTENDKIPKELWSVRNGYFRQTCIASSPRIYNFDYHGIHAQDKNVHWVYVANKVQNIFMKTFPKRWLNILAGRNYIHQNFKSREEKVKLLSHNIWTRGIFYQLRSSGD